MTSSTTAPKLGALLNRIKRTCRPALRIPFLGLLLVSAGIAAIAPSPAIAQHADPAVRYMDQVARELIGASRTRSAVMLQSVILRHADLPHMGGQAIGDYGNQLGAADRPSYLSGMVRFMAKYAASEAHKYPVSHVTFQPSSRAAKYGLMVDSTIHMRDGSTYDVAFMLGRTNGTYKVRDAQILGFSMTSQLNRLFTNYISEQGGQVRALVLALNR